MIHSLHEIYDCVQQGFYRKRPNLYKTEFLLSISSTFPSPPHHYSFIPPTPSTPIVPDRQKKPLNVTNRRETVQEVLRDMQMKTNTETKALD